MYNKLNNILKFNISKISISSLINIPYKRNCNSNNYNQLQLRYYQVKSDLNKDGIFNYIKIIYFIL